MLIKKAILAGAAAAAVAFGAGYLFFGEWMASDATPISGQRIYAEHCAACHGDRLQGQPNWQTRKPDGKLPAPPHDASGHTWHHSDQQLFDLTKHGIEALVPGYKSDMPAFAERLSDGEIRAVLAY